MRHHVKKKFLLCVMAQAVCVISALGTPVEYDYTVPYTADANTIALYHLNEGSGLTSADASTNGNALTVPLETGWRTPAEAKFGNSAYRGYADPFTAADSTSLDSLYGSVTLETWLYIPTDVSMTTSQLRGIITKTNWGDTTGFAFGIKGRGENISSSVDFRFQIGGAYLIATASDGVPIGEWFHVAATLDTDGTQRVYLNDELIGERAEPGRKIYANDRPLRINQWYGASASSFYMIFDEVRISNIAMTPVPEPATMALLLTGITGLLAARMRRKI